MALSPDKKWLAVGSHDNFIYIYDTENQFKLKSTCKGHSSYINSLDWSADSDYIRSTSGAHDLLFWNVVNGRGKQDVYGRKNSKNKNWHTKHAKKGWHVQGIYPPGEDQTQINCVASSEDGKLLATGGDHCLLRLFNDPALPNHKAKAYRGHSEHVTNAMFIGEYIFTTGG
jgi:WD40 repeat protein